jgi:hypothetical protein
MCVCSSPSHFPAHGVYLLRSVRPLCSMRCRCPLLRHADSCDTGALLRFSRDCSIRTCICARGHHRWGALDRLLHPPFTRPMVQGSMKAAVTISSRAVVVGSRDAIPSVAYTAPKTSSSPVAAAMSWEVPRTRAAITVAILRQHRRSCRITRNPESTHPSPPQRPLPSASAQPADSSPSPDPAPHPNPRWPNPPLCVRARLPVVPLQPPKIGGFSP